MKTKTKQPLFGYLLHPSSTTGAQMPSATIQVTYKGGTKSVINFKFFGILVIFIGIFSFFFGFKTSIPRGLI